MTYFLDNFGIAVVLGLTLAADQAVHNPYLDFFIGFCAIVCFDLLAKVRERRVRRAETARFDKVIAQLRQKGWY